MKQPEGAWGSPDVDELLRGHMRQYAAAQVIAAYLERSQFWITLFSEYDDPGASLAVEDIGIATRTEEYLFPSYKKTRLLGGTLLLHKVDSTTGIIIPSSTEVIAEFNDDSLMPRPEFSNCDLTVVMNAAVDCMDYDLRAVTPSRMHYA